MTERQAKLTRLPIMFLRNSPSFFSSCCLMPCSSHSELSEESTHAETHARVLSARGKAARQRIHKACRASGQQQPAVHVFPQ